MSVFLKKGTPATPISAPNPQQVRIILGGGFAISFRVRTGAFALVCIVTKSKTKVTKKDICFLKYKFMNQK
jgi:hypothetical protein